MRGDDPGQQESPTQPPTHCPLQQDYKRIGKAQMKKKKLVDEDKQEANKQIISKGKRKEKAKASDAVWKNQEASILHKCCSAIVKTLVIINQF